MGGNVPVPSFRPPSSEMCSVFEFQNLLGKAGTARLPSFSFPYLSASEGRRLVRVSPSTDRNRIDTTVARTKPFSMTFALSAEPSKLTSVHHRVLAVVGPPEVLTLKSQSRPRRTGQVAIIAPSLIPNNPEARIDKAQKIRIARFSPRARASVLIWKGMCHRLVDRGRPCQYPQDTGSDGESAKT